MKKTLEKSCTPVSFVTVVPAKMSCSPNKYPSWYFSTTVPGTDKTQDQDTALYLCHCVHLQEKTIRECCSLYVWNQRQKCCTGLKETAWRKLITLKTKFIVIKRLLGWYSGTGTYWHGIPNISKGMARVNHPLELSLAQYLQNHTWKPIFSGQSNARSHANNKTIKRLSM